MELFVWPPEFGLPSMDIESLQFMVASKFCAAPITFRYSTQPWKSPSGELPYFTKIENAEKIVDFSHFVDFLRNSKQDLVLDKDLVLSQLGEFDAYCCLLNQKLRPAMCHLFWLDRYNYGAITHTCYTQHLSFPYNLYYVSRRKHRMEIVVEMSKKKEQQLILDAIQTLNTLSAKLSDNKFFCGDKPCSLDALVFGYLAPLLRIPLPNDRLQLHLSATPNLVRFVESILSIYMPLPESILKEQKISRDLWQKRKLDAVRTMEEGRIEREQRRNEREQQKESSLRNTIFFSIGAFTLAILFAVHTGIIVVEKVDKKKQNIKARQETSNPRIKNE